MRLWIVRCQRGKEYMGLDVIEAASDRDAAKASVLRKLGRRWRVTDVVLFIEADMG
jgi:hypothetical protein